MAISSVETSSTGIRISILHYYLKELCFHKGKDSLLLFRKKKELLTLNDSLK